MDGADPLTPLKAENSEQLPGNEGEQKTLEAVRLRRMGQKHLRLGKTPNQSIICCIITNVEEFEHNAVGAREHAKQNRPTSTPRLEKAPYQYRCDKKNARIVLYREVDKFHANYLLEESVSLLADDKMFILKFSKGWLERFKKRFDAFMARRLV